MSATPVGAATTAGRDDHNLGMSATPVGAAATAGRDDHAVPVANLIRYLETGVAPDGLFAPDVFADLSLPHWRIQTGTAEELLAVRTKDHPFPGEVRVERAERTGHGFTIEFEERWDHDGQRWYSREMIRADVVDGRITEMSVFCTGDWDEARQREHAKAVRLIRP
jgi:hypothetical protein